MEEYMCGVKICKFSYAHEATLFASFEAKMIESI